MFLIFLSTNCLLKHPVYLVPGFLSKAINYVIDIGFTKNSVVLFFRSIFTDIIVRILVTFGIPFYSLLLLLFLIHTFYGVNCNINLKNSFWMPLRKSLFTMLLFWHLWLHFTCSPNIDWIKYYNHTIFTQKNKSYHKIILLLKIYNMLHAITFFFKKKIQTTNNNKIKRTQFSFNFWLFYCSFLLTVTYHIGILL